MNARRRLEELEARAHPAAVQSGARRRMKEHLDRIAGLRRAGATPQNNAELAAMSAALEGRRCRGEGGR